MTAFLDPSFIRDVPPAMRTALTDYLRSVGAELGIGLESCTVDYEPPVSAYLAIDWRLERFPDRDLALLWDERHGWSLAIETRSGEDLIVLSYLGGPTVFPRPEKVHAFVHALRDEKHQLGQPEPPHIREPAGYERLLAELPAPIGAR